MPELPEVESTRRQLAQRLEGQRIVRARFAAVALREPIPGRRLARALKGAEIVRIGRRGKYLLWELDNGHTMMAHLGMSGRFHVREKSAPPVPHTHGIWQLDDAQVHYIDPRRFGLLKLYRTEEVSRSAELAELGPEPFDSVFTVDWLASALAHSAAPIKSWLMDQKRVCGLGNIYVNEALYRSRIHPLRPARTVRAKEVPRLHQAIKDIIKAAIENAGTTFLSYQSPDGGAGAFVESLRVFQREGEPCPSCGAAIVRIRQGNRSTFFCPRCQR